jgi:hypothetical protein
LLCSTAAVTPQPSKAAPLPARPLSLVAYTPTLTGVDVLHLLPQHRTQPREPASCLQTKRRTSLSHFSRPSLLRGIVDHYLITPALEHLVMASNSGPWFHGGMCTALGRRGQSYGPSRRREYLSAAVRVATALESIKVAVSHVVAAVVLPYHKLPQQSGLFRCVLPPGTCTVFELNSAETQF